ncbi:hypothetical protein B296_00042331 [Ensete ventricosum]|uniref:Uncharacterized protein n=1 Tax=Ensete ventricosum TaxID=4639 RepID=A0A426X910_ENSVE|nr:hypothetical protein B296_00042331 [Ensete ventricosum]
MALDRGIPPDVEAPQPQVAEKEVLKSREKIGESSKGGSPFTPEIQSKPLPAIFRLPALEPYDDNGDLMEHIATFLTQMALYDTSEALMWNPRPPSIPGHPSIPDGAEAVKVLLVADRATTDGLARDATTGALVYGGRDANRWQAG